MLILISPVYAHKYCFLRCTHVSVHVRFAVLYSVAPEDFWLTLPQRKWNFTWIYSGYRSCYTTTRWSFWLVRWTLCCSLRSDSYIVCCTYSPTCWEPSWPTSRKRHATHRFPTPKPPPYVPTSRSWPPAPPDTPSWNRYFPTLYDPTLDAVLCVWITSPALSVLYVFWNHQALCRYPWWCTRCAWTEEVEYKNAENMFDMLHK